MVRTRYPSDDVDKLMLRFPSGMRQVIEQRAKDNFRSMNGEVIAILAGVLGGEPKSASEGGATPPKASPEA